MRRIDPQYQLLGTFQVSLDGQPVALPKSRKTRALLAYLACTSRRQERDRLIDLFFRDVSDPRGALRWSLSRLRSALGKEAIESTDNALALAPFPAASDIRTLEEAVEAQARPEQLAAITSHATPEFLEDLSLPRLNEFESWRATQRVRCNHLLTQALTRLVRQQHGDIEAVEHARRLVRINPASESAWALHVEALIAVKERREARRVLRLAIDELDRYGVPFSGELAALSDTLRSGVGTQATLVVPASQPRVAVNPCQCDNDELDIGRQVSEVLYRAASVNKTLTVVAPATVRHIETLPGLPDPADSAELSLHSAAYRNPDDGTVVITVQLVDTRTGDALFSWRLPVTDTTGDGLTLAIERFFSARFEIDLPIAMIQRCQQAMPEETSALEDYLLALPRMFTPDGFDPASACALLERALVKNPYFGQASIALALVRTFIPGLNDDDEAIKATLSYARKAAETSQDDAFTLGIAAIVIAQYSRDFETGMHIARRALSINPFSIMAGLSAAYVAHFAGDDEAAARYLDGVEACAPTDPITFFAQTCRAMIAYQEGRFGEALAWATRALGQNPEFVIAQRYLVASLGQLGDTEEAARQAEKLVQIDPSETLDFFERRSTYIESAQRQRLCDGLAKAGLT
ncbi:MAG: hypothetical protein AAGA41_01270 [Pseudomonadota bacterium]